MVCATGSAATSSRPLPGSKVTGAGAVSRPATSRSETVMAPATAGTPPCGTRTMTSEPPESGLGWPRFPDITMLEVVIAGEPQTGLHLCRCPDVGCLRIDRGPEELRHATPTMAMGAPLMTSSVSSTRADRPNRRRQYESLITTTGCWPRARLSSGPSRRPICARCRSAPKKSPATNCKSAGSAGLAPTPPPRIAMSADSVVLCAATSARPASSAAACSTTGYENCNSGPSGSGTCAM